MKKKLPTWLAILIVLAVSALLLSGANGLTRDKIERQAQAAGDAARQKLLPAAERFEAKKSEQGGLTYSDLEHRTLRALGHEVYDFRNPPHGRGGFQWSSIGKDWLEWSAEQYRENLSHPIAEAGFKSDLDAMLACDVCVLVLPCGRSAHTEAGWYSGAGRPVYVYQPVRQEPELMYKLF